MNTGDKKLNQTKTTGTAASHRASGMTRQQERAMATKYILGLTDLKAYAPRRGAK